MRLLSLVLAVGTLACSASPAPAATAQPTPVPATIEPTAAPATPGPTVAASAPQPVAAPADTTPPDSAAAPPSTAPPESAAAPATGALPETAAPVVAVPTISVGPDLQPLPNPNTVAVPPPGACVIVNGLPDHACTPGLLNPRLAAAQLCARTFSTRTIRPPTSYTDMVKRRLMAAYGQVGRNPLTNRPWSPTDVELDHVVSLEALGHPWSPLNLWPQPRRSTGAEPNAEEKDQVEVTVHELICADQPHATDYAARLAADWTQFRRTPVAPTTAPKDPEP